MAGRWNDEWRAEGYGRGPDRERGRWDAAEDRSFEGRDRVFGERETGLGYNRTRGEERRDYHIDYRGEDDARPDWQDRDYQGVSPAFRQHERDYETGYRANPRFGRHDTNRGGRFYGDDGRERIYREEYGYGAGPRFGSHEADERWAREMRRPGASFSGGTGGYDYERGYGDGGRSEGRGEGFEERAREAGEFFRRTGRRVANWFSDVAGEGAEMGRFEGRGARGLGPKGYKRSDERISDDAHQRLTDDPWLDASDIDLAISGGEATLSGWVASREAKHRAERIVEDVSGVTHVQNNLRVRSGGAYAGSGRSDGNGVRSEGDASMETSANATHTTTRK